MTKTEVIYRGSLPSSMDESEVRRVLQRLASKYLSHDEIVFASTEETGLLHVEQGNPLRCGSNPFFIANHIPLSFHELVELLSEARMDLYEDDQRAEAVREFQAEYRADIQAILEEGHTLGDLMDAARVGKPHPQQAHYRPDRSRCSVCGCPLPLSTTSTGALYYGSCQGCEYRERPSVGNNEPRQPGKDSRNHASEKDDEVDWDDEELPF